MNLYDYYKIYYQLTKKQKDSIEKNDFDGLEHIIQNKQNIITKIDELDINKYLENQEQPSIKKEKLIQLMKKIQKLENKNSIMIDKSKKSLLKKINVLNNQKKSNKGYNINKKYEAKFIDKKS